jgi:hypothetical protein
MSQCGNMKVCVLVIMMGVFADAGFYEDRLYKDAVQFVKECGARSLTMCLKVRILEKCCYLAEILQKFQEVDRVEAWSSSFGK